MGASARFLPECRLELATSANDGEARSVVGKSTDMAAQSHVGDEIESRAWVLDKAKVKAALTTVSKCQSGPRVPNDTIGVAILK